VRAIAAACVVIALASPRDAVRAASSRFDAAADRAAEEQRDPAAALLAQAAWNALDAGDAHTAAAKFREAIAADPRNPRLWVGAATAAFLERRDADAKAAAEQALALDPGELDASYLLGQVLHRTGDIVGAIQTYEALTGLPDGVRQKVTDAIARWRHELEVQDRMQDAVGSHFTVSFNGPEDREIADRALAALDRAYWRVGGILSTYPNAPIPVVLYTTEQFRDITRSPAWAAGAYDGTIRVPMRGALDNEAELDRVLTHEFTHALVRTLAPHGVPTWLNEGLAAALESDDLGWARRHAAQAAGPVPLSALASSFGRFTGAQAQVAYAVSALAVKRLLDERGGFAIANLLRDLGGGADLDSAFARRMQQSLADFEASLTTPR
jgi:tetratricopeptide (TPR) repeat protein